MNNILQSLTRIKQSFYDSSNRQSNVLIGILTASGSINKTSVVTGDGQAYNVRTSVVNDVKTLIFNRITDQGEAPDEIIESVDGDFDLDSMVGSLNRSLYGVVSDVRETLDVNAAITAVSGLFQTHSKVDVNTLCNYLDSCTDPTSVGVNQLKALITSNCLDGSITQTKFLKILDSVMHAGKDANEEGSLTMDTSSAYYIHNVLATVLDAVATILVMVLSAVLSALGYVIGAIAYALFTVAKIIIGKIQENVNTGIQISDPDSNTNFFKGASTALSINLDYTDSNGDYHFCLRDTSPDKANCYDLGPMIAYIWRGENNLSSFPNNSSNLNINSFFAMNLHPTRTIKWLLNSGRLQATVVGNNGLSWRWNGFGIEPFGGFDDQCFLTLEEIATIPYMTNAQICEYTGFVFAALSLLHLKPFSFMVLTGIFAGENQVPSSMWYNNNAMYNFTGMLLKYVYTYLANGNTSAVGTTYQSTQSNFTQLSMDYMSWVNDVWNSYTSADWNNSNALDKYSMLGNFQEGIINYYTNAYRRILTTSGFSSGSGSHIIYFNKRFGEVVDAIPTQRLLTFPTTNWTEVFAAIAGVVAASAVAITAVVVGKIALKRYSVSQQTVQWNKLQTVRDAYLADPSDKTKYKAYYKQVRKYNRLGRLLGYGTYDMANNWNNASEITIQPDSSEVSSENTIDLINKMVDVTDDGQITLASISGPRGLSITDVVRLIAGD